MNRRRLFASILAAVCVPLLSQCAPEDNRSTSDFTKGRLSFTHPEIWKISSQREIDPFHQVMLETIVDDVCIVTADEPDPDKNLMDAAKQFSSDAELDEGVLSSGGSTFSELAAVDGWQVVREKFEIRVLGVGAPMRRDHYRKAINGLEVTVMLQAEAEIRSGLERGLKLIRDTIEIAEE